MRLKLLFPLLVALLIPLEALGQFYTQGSDPGALKWSQIESQNYRVIYPKGLDSLAAVYARELENVRYAVSGGTGMVPNEYYKRKMPVVLHSYTANANGLVSWTPRRMELQTTPEANFPEATPWSMQLALHESRHVSQMQLGQTSTFKWLKYPFGQLVDGALAGAYGGPVFFEGDAVVAETALSKAGRGRAGDFLEYYRASFGQEKQRDYWQWLYGSQNHYTPDHYALGYLTIAGADYLYRTNFTGNFYNRIASHHGISFFNLQNTMKEASGKKFRESFSDIQASWQKQWKENEEARGPFISSTRLTQNGKRFVEYNELQAEGDFLYAVKSGLETPTVLVKIAPDGTQTKLTSFSKNAHRLCYDNSTHRIYWAELVQDPRWELRSFSNIKYIDSAGRVRTLTRNTRYYNPDVSADGTLAVAEYSPEGECFVVLLDSAGNILSRTKAPSGMQILEPQWVGRTLYANFLSADGIGILRVDGFSVVLPAQNSKIGSLHSRNGKLYFISDLNGVTELYGLDPTDGSVARLTSTRNGADNYFFRKENLVYISTEAGGKNIFSIPLSSLTETKVDFSDKYMDPVAEDLSNRQNYRIINACKNVSVPKPYSKFLHLINFHSWAPLYVDVDNISKISADNLWQSAGLGATAFFQNELGSASGTVSYHAQPSSSGWRHSGHLKFTYTGLYPVIEASLDFNDSNRYYYSQKMTTDGSQLRKQKSMTPLLDFSTKIYIPFVFSSQGWSRGLIPQLSFSVSNDLYGRYTLDRSFLSYCNMSRVTASLRFYATRKIPASCIYPRWGIGFETGFSGRPLLGNVFRSNAYAYLYGYVPGILPTHGLRLSARAAFHTNDAPYTQETLSTAPRGFNSLSSSYLGAYPFRSRFSADYAMPFASLDWSGLSPIAYLRNLELTLHADYTLYGNLSAKLTSNLFSVGADLSLRLGNFLWLPYDTRIGVSYNYNGGKGFQTIDKACSVGRNSVSLIFSVDI